MTYSFNQFELNIVDPTIAVLLDTLIVYPNLLLFDVNVTLTKGDTILGIKMTSIPYVGELTNALVETNALLRLNEFAI